MLQNAIVTAVNGDGTADVVVERAAICGGDCSKCEACMYDNIIKTRAGNRIGAHPGQQVMIETDDGRVMWATAAIYLVPLFMFFLGYGVGWLAGFRQGLNILLSFVFLGVGVLAAHYILKHSQKKTPVPVTIVSIKDGD
jgi:sigma-E factor negative regulatory protein RseC